MGLGRRRRRLLRAREKTRHIVVSVSSPFTLRVASHRTVISFTHSCSRSRIHHHPTNHHQPSSYLSLGANDRARRARGLRRPVRAKKIIRIVSHRAFVVEKKDATHAMPIMHAIDRSARARAQIRYRRLRRWRDRSIERGDRRRATCARERKRDEYERKKTRT